MKFEWECIFEFIHNEKPIIKVTNRAKIFGGWIVHDYFRVEDNFDTNMIFIPDPKHEWSIESEEHKNKSVDELELMVRSSNCLKAECVKTIGQLINISSRELMKIPNFGRQSLKDVKEALSKLGLSLKD